MMKWVFKAKKVAEVPLKSWDNFEECYSSIQIFHGANGHIYYAFIHSDWQYCPLHDCPLENCLHWERNRSCNDCPDTSYFLYLENDDFIFPVNRLT